ncbi:MAG: ankyrin repeat domain-containing protein [Micromonosporaceae bacterium]
MSSLPERPSLEFLRKRAKARNAERRIGLSRAQHQIAREYGFDSWPKLVHHVQAAGLAGIERALTLADAAALAGILDADSGAATRAVDGLVPLLFLLRVSTAPVPRLRDCVRLLLDAGADPGSGTPEWGGQGRRTALYDAIDHPAGQTTGRARDTTLVRQLLDAGATSDEDAFYHACEQSGSTLLDLLHRPGFEGMVNRKLDFEDADGLRWFLDRGIDVNAHRCLHHAIGRGRSIEIITLLLDAGAEVNLPWDRWDVGRRPLALAARCGHLAAYHLLAARGATAELDAVDRAVLAVARGESTRLPTAPAPVLGTPAGNDFGWILGQFAGLGRTEVVAALLDAGMDVDTRGWSNFTPLDQAAMHGRVEVVRLLVERGADLHDCAFDDDGPTPLDCAVWGLQNNRQPDGDYPGVVAALVAAGAPTRRTPPTGDPAVDLHLTAYLDRGGPGGQL